MAVLNYGIFGKLQAFKFDLKFSVQKRGLNGYKLSFEVH